MSQATPPIKPAVATKGRGFTYAYRILVGDRLQQFIARSTRELLPMAGVGGQIDSRALRNFFQSILGELVYGAHKFTDALGARELQRSMVCPTRSRPSNHARNHILTPYLCPFVGTHVNGIIVIVIPGTNFILKRLICGQNDFICGLVEERR